MGQSDNKPTDSDTPKTKHKTAPAAKFLLIIAAVIVLILVGGIIFTTNEGKMMTFAFVPSGKIADEKMAPAPDYADASAWAARPGAEDTAGWKPEGVMDAAVVPGVDVFYIHPTTYLNKASWNAPYNGDAKAVRWVRGFALKYQASAFNLAGQVYAPKYRQATFGAFLDTSGQGVQAIMRAHADVLKAFDYYIAHDNGGRPFILVGHSQGALHALMLLKERLANSKLKNRMVAAYIIGWPVSVEGDIDALDGINGCEGRTDTGCVISYQSFGKDGDASPIVKLFDAMPGLNGKPHTGTHMLCTNPLDWKIGSREGAKANKGAVPLFINDKPIDAPIPGLTGARCGKDGILYLDNPPGGEGIKMSKTFDHSDAGDWREYVMTGDNYHVYDLNLFYMNIRENAAARARAWLEAHQE
ncbi:DUF3089 domain-containing protein [Kordiimonas marina]|uniref:DUF3089 domain-containing protein n=1 Tax=Kordiimonas marina TaxID=2872312 RepID=UPI001FF40C36|nr:DUF3089 domain-containing protein [Kordiimonas marina]MCJ9429216.1 DUF3089 domain-containing protein [Kordiimonas marina]